VSDEVNPSTMPVYFAVDRQSGALLAQAASDDYDAAKSFADNEDGIVVGVSFMRKKGNEIDVYERKAKPRSVLHRVFFNGNKCKLGFK